MRKILTVALAGVLAATMLFAGCSKKEESKIPEKIIVGTNAEFPPFEYVDDNKKVDGFDIALMKEIAKRMDKKIEIQNMEFKSLIGSMESKTINVVAAGMTKTEERQNAVDIHPIRRSLLTKTARLQNCLSWTERKSVFRKVLRETLFHPEINSVSREKKKLL